MSQDPHHLRYFDNLNYSLANEDTSVELAAISSDTQSILAVAGSGARVLPLIAHGPKRLVCVDLSAQQLMLTELRAAAMRALDLDDYLAFWGYPPRSASPVERRRIFDSLDLNEETRAFLRRGFEERGWTSILYAGRWERTFAKMQRLNNRFTGRSGQGLFEARTLDEQREYLRTRFPRKRWLTALGIMGNPIAFNLMLYHGDFPKKNIPHSPFAFYRDTFDHLFNETLARENYFLQIVFFGEIRYPEANPIECHPEVYERIKTGLDDCELIYEQGDVLRVLSHYSSEFDFISLSDVPSYLAPPAEQEFLQVTRGAVKPGGRVVARYYLRVPEDADRTGWKDVSIELRSEIEHENVGVYRVEVLDAV